MTLQSNVKLLCLQKSIQVWTVLLMWHCVLQNVKIKYDNYWHVTRLLVMSITHAVCNNREGVIGNSGHCYSHMQVLHGILVKCVTQSSQSLDIKISSAHTIIWWYLLYSYKIQVVRMANCRQEAAKLCFLSNYIIVHSVITQHLRLPVVYHFPSGWVHEQPGHGTGISKSTNGHRNTPACWKMYVVCHQQTRAFWTDVCGGHCTATTTKKQVQSMTVLLKM